MTDVVPCPGGDAILLSGGLVLTCDPAIGDFRVGDVLVRNGRIAAVGPKLDASDATVVDASNRIVLPGFVDTHHHMWEGLLRNALVDASLDRYFSNSGTSGFPAQPKGLVRVNRGFGLCHEPVDAHAGEFVCALGALNGGTTSVLDWCQMSNSPEHTDAVVQALKDSGIRAVFGYAEPSRGPTPWYKDHGHAYPEDLRRLRKGALSDDDGRVTLALAALGPDFIPDEQAEREWRIANELGVRISVHVGTGQHGQSGRLGQFQRRLGLMNERTTYIHCNQTTDDEWRMIADTGGTVSLASYIEMQMGLGITAVDQALAVGIQPSLSVDVEVAVPGDMFTQMKSCFQTQRGLQWKRQIDDHAYEPKVISARDVVRYATIEGARANGMEGKVGSLTPGKLADLQLLRTDAINVMPLNDPYGAIVSGMDTSNVDAVMVGGKFLKWAGSLTGIDLRSVQRTVDEAHERVLSRFNSTAEPDGKLGLVACVGHTHG